MNSFDWPRAYGAPPLRGVLRQTPADFFVEERLGFEPDGRGEHCWLWIEKENINTADAAQHLARFAGLRERDISYSGLKDKRAVARQWFSLHVLNREIEWQQWSDPSLRILRIARHSKKLRRGTHRSNFFQITLRDAAGDSEALAARLEQIRAHGVPNYFGEQRFGRDGRTLALARNAAEQRRRLPRQQAGLYFSALRSYLFNEVLARRVTEQTWQLPQAGELFMLSGSNSVFHERIDAALLARLQAGDIHLSGPLAGADSGAAARESVLLLEQSVLGEHQQLVAYLADAKVESARRSLRLLPKDLRAEAVGPDAWRFSFTLARGCFATSLMRELADYYSSATD